MKTNSHMVYSVLIYWLKVSHSRSQKIFISLNLLLKRISNLMRHKNKLWLLFFVTENWFLQKIILLIISLLSVDDSTQTAAVKSLVPRRGKMPSQIIVKSYWHRGESHIQNFVLPPFWYFVQILFWPTVNKKFYWSRNTFDNSKAWDHKYNLFSVKYF